MSGIAIKPRCRFVFYSFGIKICINLRIWILLFFKKSLPIFLCSFACYGSIIRPYLFLEKDSLKYCELPEPGDRPAQ